MALNKRILRELKKNIFRYAALFIMLAAGMAVFIGLAASVDSIIDTVKRHNKKNQVEDGNFTLDVPLSDTGELLLDGAEGRLAGNFYVDYLLEDDTSLRLYKNRLNINIIDIREGAMPAAANEIALEHHYAGQNGYRVGSTIIIGGRELLVSGLCSAPDYNLIVSSVADVSANPAKFSIAFASTDGYEKLLETGNTKSGETYNYSFILGEDTTAEEYRDMLKSVLENHAGTTALTSFLAAEDNPRISSYEEDIMMTKLSAVFAGTIFVILAAYMITVFIIDNIERESQIIGMLYTLGYRKKELLFHFTLLPVLIVACASALGTGIGFGLTQFLAKSNAQYYSFPEIESYYSIWLLLYGTVLPILLAFTISVFVLNKKLTGKPLHLLRRDVKKSPGSRLKLKNRTFINTFAVRQLLREIRGNITLFAGLFLSVMLMVFGFSIYGNITKLIEGAEQDVQFSYMYLLNEMPEEIPDNAEPAFTKTLKSTLNITDTELDITLQGLSSGNPYYALDTAMLGKGEVIISDAFADKFGYSIGDEVSFTDDISEETYTYRVADITAYRNGLFVFADIKEMRQEFGQPEDYYNTLLTMEELDIGGSSVITVYTREELIESISLFMELMGGMIIMLIGMSIIVFIVVMFLLVKMMIDKATDSISLLKIFGYNDREIKKVYLGSVTYTVIIAAAVSLPVNTVIVKLIFPFMVTNIAAGMKAYVAPVHYVLMAAGILGTYFIMRMILNRHLKKISFAEVLKNRE